MIVAPPGFFCGPILDYASNWRNKVPGGNFALFLVTVGLGVVMFTNTEGMSAKDAAYYSVITGTTIGYGDLSPTSDNGKIAAAIYALIAVNVVGALLDGPKEFLTNLVSDDLVSFEEVDKDHDGKIDREEFAALKKELAALKKAQ